MSDAPKGQKTDGDGTNVGTLSKQEEAAALLPSDGTDAPTSVKDELLERLSQDDVHPDDRKPIYDAMTQHPAWKTLLQEPVRGNGWQERSKHPPQTEEEKNAGLPR